MMLRTTAILLAAPLLLAACEDKEENPVLEDREEAVDKVEVVDDEMKPEVKIDSESMLEDDSELVEEGEEKAMEEASTEK